MNIVDKFRDKMDKMDQKYYEDTKEHRKENYDIRNITKDDLKNIPPIMYVLFFSVVFVFLIMGAIIFIME